MKHTALVNIPHDGFLCKLLVTTDSSPSGPPVTIYSIPIRSPLVEGPFPLHFTKRDFEHLQRVFKCMDRDSLGFIHVHVFQQFCVFRCPSLRVKRDQDSAHFDQLWNWVLDLQWSPEPRKASLSDIISASDNGSSGCDTGGDQPLSSSYYVGLEAWMIFARCLSLFQYHEAKRKFSGGTSELLYQKGKQAISTEKHKNSSSEEDHMIMVDLPSYETSQEQLTIQALLEYEAEIYDQYQVPWTEMETDPKRQSTLQMGNGIMIPLPELDLDHSYISMYDDTSGASLQRLQMTVQVSVYTSSSIPSSDLEFILQTKIQSALKYTNGMNHCDEHDDEEIIVKRSFSDMEWLHQQLKKDIQLGGALCGRIVPPFPSKLVMMDSGTDYEESEGSANATTLSLHNTLIASSIPVTKSAVKTGVGIMTLAGKTAKSFLWKGMSVATGTMTTHALQGSSTKSQKGTIRMSSEIPTNTQSHSTLLKLSPHRSKKTFSSPSQDALQSKAKQLERYLNYMLEHPALSSSFALHMILTASQGGLDAAKEVLKEIKMQSDDSLKSMYHQDGRFTASESMSPTYQSPTLKSHMMKYLKKYPYHAKDLSFIRTAAQAALVLKLDGLLESAGYQSTSTKLQHASLPKLVHSRNPDLDDSDHGDGMTENLDSSGVLGGQVRKDLEFGDFDLLPDPLPLSERSVLCAKSNPEGILSIASGSLYSDAYDSHNAHRVTAVGEIDIEKDVRSLCVMLKSVDKSLASCCGAIHIIGEGKRSRIVSQMSILRNIDSWQGMRGQIIMQRYLLKSVSSLEASGKIHDAGLGNFSSDIVWNASLASASVAAAKDVKRVVEAARTAKKAKQTADSVVDQCVSALNTDIYKTDEEVETLKDSLSKHRMQSIHAAVVEHETFIAKRKAAISLANDVKYWNAHRKRSLLQACKDMVYIQLESSKRDVDAWTELKDGILSSPHGAFIEEKIISYDNISDAKCLMATEVTPSSQGYETDRFGVDEFILFDPCQEDLSEDEEDALDTSSTVGVGVQKDRMNENIMNEYNDALDESLKSQKSADTITPDYKESNLPMSDSMQSLVEGLLSWGGNCDAEDDFNVPRIMATYLS